MVYLTARTASHLYKSPSSIDLTNNGSKSLSVTVNGSAGGKYNSLLYCSPSVRFNSVSNSSSSNSSGAGSRCHGGSSWTLNTRNGGHQYEYSQSKSTLDLTWAGKANQPQPAKKLKSISTQNLKSKSLYNIRQPLLTSTPPVPNHNNSQQQHHSNHPSNHQVPLLGRMGTLTLSRTDRRSNEQLRMAKQRASILWLIAKANDNGRIPTELRDPFYRDHNGAELLKPWITQRLANGELYGRALANIYGVPDYSCLGHQGILQLLTRRGVYLNEMTTYDEPITETLLLKTSPVKLNAHMVIIECILTLYIREILIPVKVGEVVSRFTGDFENFDASSHEQDMPPTSDPEDVALFWVNRACAQLNQEISREYMVNEADSQIDSDEPCPVVPSLEELSDMCDGCSLFALLAFYCPTQLDWREICLKQDISIADSIYNLQRVQYFSADNFPSDVCFLTLEDFLYLPELLVPNFLAFIADLLYLFEIQPVECVTAPYLRLYPDGYTDEFHPNYPQLPTPAEMKARSLKHQSWNDSLEMSTAESSAFFNHPSTHQLYNDRRSSLYKTGSNTALNQTTSRRNSLTTANNNNGSRILHRRSSIMSNGSEPQAIAPSGTVLNQGDIDEAYANGGMGGRHQHYHHGGLDVDSENGMVLDSGGQLSSYFSTLSIANQQNNRLGAGQATNSADAEYYKNRNRAASGHLTDYFSNLTLTGASPDIVPPNYPNNNRTNTHVRAKAGHPNNADNVKSLLSQHHHDLHHLPHHHLSAFTNAANDSSQTTSSETSSIAELSEYSDLVRAQLNEKRKQIELERQHEREKRQSVDQNFRQEVLRTLKGLNNSGGESNSDIDNASESGVKLMDTVNNNSGLVEDENLTFEIHELNPIRREKTFTSLASSKSLSNSSSYIRKNLFSASEDLKASMTDLNYANAKESSANKSRLNNTDELNVSNKNLSSKSIETLSKLDSTFNEKNSPSPVESIVSATNVQPTHVQPISTNQNVPEPTILSPTNVPLATMANAVNTPPRRNQWGQPMIPLGGQYAQPPTWSQTPGGPYPDWYGAQAAGYPPPPQPYPYPYTMAPPGGPPMRPYSLHMDPSQYPPYATQDPYMSMGYMTGPPPANSTPTPPNMSGAAIEATSLYSSSPVLNHSTPANSQHANAATFRVPRNGTPLQNGVNADQLNTQPNTNHSINQTADFSADSINANVDPSFNDSNNHHHAANNSSEKHNEAFFISFPDERPVRSASKQQLNASNASINRTPKTPKQELLSPEKQPLSRTATQTLVSRASGDGQETKSTPDKDQMTDKRIKQLYEVKRPVASPGVAFIIGTDDAAADEPLPVVKVNGEVKVEEEVEAEIDDDDDNQTRPITEDDMVRKKELIMKQSLRRRIQQEEQRAQKEQELAAKRESEQIRREQMDRKKEEERAKRAFILEQYKQRKQLEEEMEKNGGPLQVSRSSSTLVLNRTGGGAAGQVTMRPQRILNSAGRPRPKSLHSTMIGLDGNPINSGSPSMSSTGTVSRHSNSRDEIDRVGAASRPQSALSSQVNSAVTTPTGGPFGDQFEQFSQYNSTGPTSSNFYNEYNGPKLFVKPSQKSNKTLILNAINAVLAGAVNAETNRRVAEVINSCDSKYYLILFRNSGLQYRAIYSYYPERDEVTKLDGIGPRAVNNEMIDKFYKYNSGTKNFTPIQTKHLCVTIDAFTIHNNLWMTKKQQQQQQMTPRRFM